MIISKIAGWSIPLCMLVFLLLFPVHIYERTLLSRYIVNSAHFIIGMGVMLFLSWCFPVGIIFRLAQRKAELSCTGSCPRWKLGVVICISLGVLIVLELIQPFAGRSSDAIDFVLGLAGVLCAACLLNAWRIRTRKRWCFILFALMLIISVIIPVPYIVFQQVKIKRMFPGLVSFEYPYEMWGLEIRNVDVERVSTNASHGVCALELVRTNTMDYSGITIIPLNNDWTGAAHIALDVTLNGRINIPFWVRVDDKLDPAYRDRGQSLLSLHPGFQTIRLPLETLAETPSGRQLNLGNIHSMTLFFDKASPTGMVVLDNIRLIND